MPSLKLTDRFVQTARPIAAASRTDYNDEVQLGLVLRTTSNDARTYTAP